MMGSYYLTGYMGYSGFVATVTTYAITTILFSQVFIQTRNILTNRPLYIPSILAVLLYPFIFPPLFGLTFVIVLTSYMQQPLAYV